MGYAQIINRVFTFAPDKALVLANAEYVRPMVYPGNWSKIRIGLLCAIDSSVSLADAAFYVGLSSSSGPPVSSYATKNYLGVSMLGTPTGLARTATLTGTTNQYFSVSSNAVAFRKYEGYFTTAAAAAGLAFIARAAQGQVLRRSPIIIDIVRAMGWGGNTVINIWGCNSASVLIDYRPDQLLAALDTPSNAAPVLNGQSMTQWGANIAITTGDGLGALDCLSVYWSRAYAPLELHALSMVVLNQGYEYSGTLQAGGFQNFESYAVGTVVASTLPSESYRTFNGTGTYAVETGWMSRFAMSGTYSNAYVQEGYAGTSYGDPSDSFQSYGTGTALPSVVSAGTNWLSYGTFYGTAAPSAQYGWAGTSMGYPLDTFESYGTGTVTAGFLSAGTGWESYGTIY